LKPHHETIVYQTSAPKPCIARAPALVRSEVEVWVLGFGALAGWVCWFAGFVDFSDTPILHSQRINASAPQRHIQLLFSH